MDDGQTFRRGDRVVHPLRREWGEGVIDQTASIMHEGRPAQRVVVTFANKGRVTMNTGVASLVHKDQATMYSRASSATSTTSSGWLDSLTQRNPLEALWQLPESMTDPFSGEMRRLQATLDSYRFTAQPRDAKLLLEWAISQTGLEDPLTQFTRQEIEQALPRFVRDRDNHLLELVRQLKRQGSTTQLQQLASRQRDAAAREALLKALKR